MRPFRLALVASLVAVPAMATPPACSSISVIQLAGYNCEAAGLLFYFPSSWTFHQTVSTTIGNGSLVSATAYDLVWTTIGNRVTLSYVPIGAQTLAASAIGTEPTNFARLTQLFNYQVFGPLASIRGIWGTPTIGLGADYSGASAAGFLTLRSGATRYVSTTWASGETTLLDGSREAWGGPPDPSASAVNATATFQSGAFVVGTATSVSASTDVGQAEARIAAQWATEFESAGGTHVTATPEPSTWALMGTGLLVLGWMARRRLA